MLLDPPPTPLSRARQSLHALIVDDSMAQRRLMASVLGRAGLVAHEAATPVEALQLLASADGADIRMILSGWRMPGMDGPDFCRAFRALNRSGYAYVILMTSDQDRAAKARGLEAGADDFLTRPVDIGELHARIHAGRRILDMEEALVHSNHEVRSALAELQSLHDGIARDLREARRLQRAFLPPRHAARGEGELSLRLLSCNQVGGDLVGWFDLPDNRIALYSIDVSGHGIASALLTGRLSGMFSGRWRRGNIAFGGSGGVRAPNLVMERLNDFMLQELTSDIYFTAVLATIDLTTGEVELCQAGHPHPLVRRASGRVDRVGGGGPPIGLLEGAEFELTRLSLGRGDSLLIHTDGLTECTDTWGGMLGEEGLMAILSDAPDRTEEAMDYLERGLRRHAGIAGFDDDLSMILMRHGAPSAREVEGRGRY